MGYFVCSKENSKLTKNVLRLPFELNSAKRFMFVNLLQSMSCWSGTTILITIISMYFGIILYIRAFLGDFKFFLDDMDMQAKDDDKAALSATMRALVNFHVEITEWVFMLKYLEIVANFLLKFNRKKLKSVQQIGRHHESHNFGDIHSMHFIDVWISAAWSNGKRFFVFVD